MLSFGRQSARSPDVRRWENCDGRGVVNRHDRGRDFHVCDRRRGALIDGFVLRGNHVEIEPLLDRGPAIGASYSGESRHSGRHCVLIIDEITVEPVLHDFDGGSLRKRNHRSAAGQCLDHDHAERFIPADGHQQCACVGEQAPLAFSTSLADVPDTSSVDVRFDLGLEVVFLPWLHRAGQYQRRRSGAGGGDCAVRALFFSEAAGPQQVAAIAAPERPVGDVDRNYV